MKHVIHNMFLTLEKSIKIYLTELYAKIIRSQCKKTPIYKKS